MQRTIIDGGYIATAVTASTVAVQKVAHATHPVVWIGLELPNYVGFIVLLAALLFGSLISFHQKTAVDQFINYPKLKPFYSFGFGFFVTLFGIPLKYPNLTAWDLVVPGLFLSAIGSQVIYYVIAFTSSRELWDMIKERFLLIVRGGKS